MHVNRTPGYPIVAIHGSASAGSQWQSLCEAMAPRRKVICPDLPGYGLSRMQGVEAHESLDADAANVARLIALPTLGPIHLVGHSFGGAVVLKLAMAHAKQIASLTLIEPAAFHILQAQTSRGDRDAYREIGALWGKLKSDGMATFVDYWNGVGAWQHMKPSVQARLKDQVMSVDRNFQAVLSEDWTLDACRQIVCPTLIIRGAQSQRPATRTSALLAEAIPGAKLHDIAGAGHMVPLTHANVTNHLTGDHISSTDLHLAQNQIKAA